MKKSSKFLVGIITIFTLGYFLFMTSCKENSITKEECNFCNGTGEKDCLYCYGKGNKNCSRCYGQGQNSCNKCNGMGRISQYVGHMYKDGFQYININGISGYVQVTGGTATVNCNECNSTGKVKCSNYSCENGNVECNYCYGHGKEKCTYCNGNGYK